MNEEDLFMFYMVGLAVILGIAFISMMTQH